MSVPRLNRRLVLEAPQRVADGAGGYSETWVALGQIWADVSPRGMGRETDASTARVTVRIIVRAAPHGAPSRPDATMRFRDGARVYRIAAVTEQDALGRYLICYASEETGA